MTVERDNLEMIVSAGEDVSRCDGSKRKIEIYVVFLCKPVRTGVDLLPGIGSQFLCDSAFPGIRPAHGVVLVEAVVAVGGFRDLHRVHERPGTTVRKIGDISAVVRVVVGHEDIKVFIVNGKLLQGVFHIV